jgi:prolyl oligopeptidase
LRKTFAVAAAVWLGLLLPAAAADDPFLWLEERHGERALAWVTEQNELTKTELSRDPRLSDYWEMLLDLYSADDNIPYVSAQGGFLYNFWQDENNVLGLWRRTTSESYKSASPKWETIIDFDRLAEKEGTDWVFVYADCLWPEYTRCLVMMSPDGGDAAAVREFDIKTKSFVKDGFFSPVSKSSFTWFDQDTVIVTAAYTEEEQTTSGYPRVIKRLRRGQKLEAAQTIYSGEVDDLSVSAYPSGDGGYMIFRDIDFYNSETLLIDGRIKRKIPLPTDKLFAINFKGQMVFSLRSTWKAPDGTIVKPGGLYSFDYGFWDLSSKIGRISTVLEPSDRMSVSGVSPTADKLFVSLVDNVRGKVLSYDYNQKGWSARKIALPDNGDIAISHTDYEGSSVSFSFQDFLTPPSLIWSDDDGITVKTVKALKERFDASPFRAEQFEATSKDGTKVPYFVVRAKDQSEPRPTLLYGYGGFEVSMTPWYSGMRGRLWLEQGNVFVVANIRGGGEFGPEWHQAAIGENRQRAFDDFAAIGEDLIARKMTTTAQLSAMGGSNGGLLAGVMLTQRPDLFGAIISEVPLLDMLRYTELPPGASWIAEYGDPAIPEEAAWIAEYSPYQNVTPDEKYPPVLFTTSTADDRVHPGHARKMAALMQSMGHNARFIENTAGGHGGSGDIRRAALTSAMEMLFLQRSLEGEANHPASVDGPIDLDVASRALPASDAAAEAGLDCAQLGLIGRAARSSVGFSASLATRYAELQRNCVRTGKTPPFN